MTPKPTKLAKPCLKCLKMSLYVTNILKTLKNIQYDRQMDRPTVTYNREHATKKCLKI